MAKALVWAVKLGHVQIAEYLLLNNEDLKTKSESGSSILFIALESELWQEEDFLKLWSLVKNSNVMDVNCVSKGRSLLHFGIEKEWNRFVKMLVLENASTVGIKIHHFLNTLMRFLKSITDHSQRMYLLAHRNCKNYVHMKHLNQYC